MNNEEKNKNENTNKNKNKNKISNVDFETILYYIVLGFGILFAIFFVWLMLALGARAI